MPGTCYLRFDNETISLLDDYRRQDSTMIKLDVGIKVAKNRDLHNRPTSIELITIDVLLDISTVVVADWEMHGIYDTFSNITEFWDFAKDNKQTTILLLGKMTYDEFSDCHRFIDKVFLIISENYSIRNTLIR